jgi:flagellar basal-body rod modification protein FlgD
MTSIPAVNLTNSSNQTGQSGSETLPQQTLGQKDFLNLLVTQLSAQDPLNPISNTDFIAQMAQFSTLQQTQTMQQNLAGIEAGQVALQASSLLGKTAQVQPASGQPVSGVVSAVSFQGGTPSITINGQSYDLSQVLSVSMTQ